MKSRRKLIVYKIARLIADIIILPLIIFYKLETWLLKTEEPFVGISQLISLFPGLFGNLIRTCFYEKSLKPFGQSNYIGFGTVLQGAKQAVEGVYFSYQLKFDDKNKELFEFKQRYLKEYGKEPVNVLYAALGYDNVMLVAETLKNSGSDSDSIRIQLLETKDFKGIVGISDFDKNGVANRTQHINKVENGKFIAVN